MSCSSIEGGSFDSGILLDPCSSALSAADDSESLCEKKFGGGILASFPKTVSRRLFSVTDCEMSNLEIESSQRQLNANYILTKEEDNPPSYCNQSRGSYTRSALKLLAVIATMWGGMITSSLIKTSSGCRLGHLASSIAGDAAYDVQAPTQCSARCAGLRSLLSAPTTQSDKLCSPETLCSPKTGLGWKIASHLQIPQDPGSDVSSHNVRRKGRPASELGPIRRAEPPSSV
eukprot:CAMPEP_0172207574 /NCGR_PEP_ID=MMETSP1050-20130122/33917_1 /TAXON_ID=233186 /ORGANISM="Cryptomonas curvata, Strain CCAP979/52" /LENGTH=230 /DNA_ID=CAMNT_0012886919 /DNA_START=230 /DNA_END=919 /DNA_ORIENTATION=+